MRADVRFGSLADILRRNRHVRFTLKSETFRPPIMNRTPCRGTTSLTARLMADDPLHEQLSRDTTGPRRRLPGYSLPVSCGVLRCWLNHRGS